MRPWAALGAVGAIVVLVFVFATIGQGTGPAGQPAPATSGAGANSATQESGATVSLSPTATHSITPAPGSSVAPTAASDVDEGEPFTPAVFSTEADAAALDVGERFWSAFTDASLTREEWLAKLKPLVSEQFYAFWLRGNDPAATSTGQKYSKNGTEVTARVERTTAPELTHVIITTTRFEITVTLIRASDDAAWIVMDWA